MQLIRQQHKQRAQVAPVNSLVRAYGHSDPEGGKLPNADPSGRPRQPGYQEQEEEVGAVPIGVLRVGRRDFTVRVHLLPAVAAGYQRTSPAPHV